MSGKQIFLWIIVALYLMAVLYGIGGEFRDATDDRTWLWNYFFRQNFTFDPIASFNWYRIDGVYQYRWTQDVWRPLQLFLPVGFLFGGIFVNFSLKKWLILSFLVAIVFSLLQVLIAFLGIFANFMYNGELNTGRIFFYASGFFLGFVASKIIAYFLTE